MSLNIYNLKNIKLNTKSYLTTLIFCFALCSSYLIADDKRNKTNIEFDSALSGVNFDPKVVDGNGSSQGHTAEGNGILDADEMAVVAAILNNPSFDLSATNGIDYKTVKEIYSSIIKTAETDLVSITDRFPTSVSMVTGYIMVGTLDSFNVITHMTAMFGSTMNGDYSSALALGKFLGPEGDADGDGYTNLQEYNVFRVKSRKAYIDAVLDPNQVPTGLAAKPFKITKKDNNKKTVGIILYPDFEVLDVYGPVEMWGYVEEFNIIMIAEKIGPVMSTQGVATVADYSFESAPKLDILMVPGGVGTIPELENGAILEFIKKRNQETEMTTSVCTGSALLAKAGILDGLKATTNKRFFYLSSQQSKKVDWIKKARWVEDGKVITSSGVSAGTDMALGLIASLYGKERAEKIASSVEYQWNDDPNNDPFTEFVRQ